MKHMRIALALALSVLTAACGSKSPTAPTPSATPTKIITVTGDLAFGNVDIGASAERTFTIGNSGNTVLTFTGLTCQTGSTTGFSATPTSGTVPPASTVPVTVRFSPTAAQFYTCVLAVTADHTGGENRINMSGSGINNTPLFTRSGTGDNVFDLPSTVNRIRVQAVPGSSCQNFIVRVRGSLIINTILGTCSVADARSLDSTYLTTGGGTVQITGSTGVSWTFTEVR